MVKVSGQPPGDWLMAHEACRRRSRSLFAMNRLIVAVLVILLLKVMLPRRTRWTASSVRPYSSVFDTAVPTDVACSPLCDPIELLRQRTRARIARKPG